jgi:hypothetical protein
MNASQWFKSMDDADLQAWVAQYGEAAQAAFYRNVPRRKAGAEMKRRGLKPLSLPRTPRPRGYGSPTGYLPNWGLMSE